MLPDRFSARVFRWFDRARGPGEVPRRRRSRPARRRLLLEPLEGRNLLAITDLGAIGGTVFDDFSGNGLDPGEAVSGAQVDLYRDDNSNMTFEPGAGDTLILTTNTNASGEYRFDGLTAGGYFVRQPAQSVGGATLLQSDSALITISSTDAEGTVGTTIDSFDQTVQSASASSGSTPATSSTTATEAIGGERDLFVTHTSGTMDVEIQIDNSNSNLLSFAAGPTDIGQRVVIWDGVDSDAANLAATGLGGVDLTNGGQDVGIGLTIGADNTGGELEIRVYTDGTNFSSQILSPIPNTGGAATELELLRFANFTTSGGTGADFTNVGAIELEVLPGTTTAVDGQIDLVATRGPTTTTQNFANFEEVDLRVSKSVNNGTPNVGDNVIFTIVVTNDGPDDATGVAVSDPLPSGLTFVSSTPSTGSYSNGSGVWTIGALANGASVNLQIEATVANIGTKTNTAQVSVADQFDTDSTVNNNVASEDDQDSADVTPMVADLSLTKSVDNATPNVGDNITFTVVLMNDGPDDATGVTVGDVLPAGVTFVSSTATVGSYNSGTGVWSVGSLTSGSGATLMITASVDTTGTKTNTAQVTAADQADSDSTPNNGVAMEDDQDSADVTPQIADLSLTKTVDDATPSLGQNVVFTITLTNDGPSNASNITVSDTIPTGMTFVSATPAPGTTYNSGTGVWSVPTLTASASTTLMLTASVDTTGTKTNTAEVTAADQADSDSTPNNNVGSEDDQDDASVTPEVIDLSIDKVVDNATPNIGDTVVFMVTLGNAGPNDATGVTVQDALPAGLTFVSATPSTGSYNNATGVWTVGNLSSGANATLQITASVATAGAKTNTAQVSAANQGDVDSTPNNNVAAEDDQDDAVVTPLEVDLAIDKVVDNSTPSVGDNVTFTVTLSNAGPGNATNVTVSDVLPTGLSFVSAVPSQGLYTAATGVWSVGTVNNGGSANLQIFASVDSAGAKINTAEVTGLDQADTDSTPNNNVATEDDQDDATVTPQNIDLSITKTVNNATPNVGDNVTFTVTLSNDGPGNASNVTVADTLPAGLTFVSATPAQGSYDNNTGIWTVGSLANGANTTLQIVASVDSVGAKTNTAQVAAALQQDSDSTPNNNVAAEDDQDDAVVTPPVVDLSVTKSVNDAAPNVGDNVTFTVTVSNGGPDNATNVSLSDALPSGLTFVSATPSQGTYNNSTGSWTIGTINNGASATLQLIATVATNGTKTNTAQISAVDQADSDSTPNNSVAAEDDQDDASLTPQEVDLSVTKTVNDATPDLNDNVVFTVTVLNSGPNTATNTVLSDLLPTGLTFVSATTSQGSYSETTGLWTVGSLANGASATLTVTATVTTRGGKTNTAQVTAIDQFDVDSTPNNNAEGEDDQAAVLVQPPFSLSKRLFLSR